MHDPQPETPDWATEAEVIRALRMCPDCHPADYILCQHHEGLVTALYAPCGDSDCPACAHDAR